MNLFSLIWMFNSSQLPDNESCEWSIHYCYIVLHIAFGVLTLLYFLVIFPNLTKRVPLFLGPKTSGEGLSATGPTSWSFLSHLSWYRKSTHVKPPSLIKFGHLFHIPWWFVIYYSYYSYCSCLFVIIFFYGVLMSLRILTDSSRKSAIPMNCSWGMDAPRNTRLVGMVKQIIGRPARNSGTWWNIIWITQF